jgi:A/G-specific adenine glycosylase
LIDAVYQQFSQYVLNWYDLHGRKNLPWHLPRDPYRIWISEIMLQQTQVQTVIPYFHRFIEQLPSLEHLAKASEDSVLSLWSGLGYYSRARNLRRSAQIIMSEYQSVMPMDLETLIDLPGIGPSTAAAILSQAFNKPTAILDGNVKRVLARFFGIHGWPEQASVKKQLWSIAHSCMPQERCADYTQAIMDLGALLCTLRKPNCTQCPLKVNCHAQKEEEQHLLPTPKPRRPVPVHKKSFLVLSNEHGMIYLIKRPPVGVWGGLWCLPDIDTEECPLSYIEQQYALHGDDPKPLLAFKHRLSHFHLEIKAFSITTRPLNKPRTASAVAEPNGLWVNRDSLKNLGLAKPTSVILNNFLERQG